jgi:hypothetical protein
MGFYDDAVHLAARLDGSDPDEYAEALSELSALIRENAALRVALEEIRRILVGDRKDAYYWSARQQCINVADAALSSTLEGA